MIDNILNNQYVTCPKCGTVTAFTQSATHYISCRREEALNNLQRTIHDQFHKESCTCNCETNKDQ